MNVLIELLPVLLPLILECINREGEDATRRNLSDPGPFVQFKAFRALRKAGLGFADARARAGECCDALRAATDDDVAALVQEAKQFQGV